MYDSPSWNRHRTRDIAMPAVTTPIETERLQLRPFAESDLDALANILARPDVMRYLDEEPRTRDEVAAVLRQRTAMNRLEHQDDTLMLAIELKDSGAMIGSVNLIWRSQEHGQGEVGYTLHPDHQGKGYAGEAVRAIMGYGFREIELHRIVGCCDDRNVPSIRVLERLGMRREAHFREHQWVKGEWRSQFIYAMLRDDWDAKAR
jgi:RimJ/RimL family protein N-acetyltransferase